MRQPNDKGRKSNRFPIIRKPRQTDYVIVYREGGEHLLSIRDLLSQVGDMRATGSVILSTTSVSVSEAGLSGSYTAVLSTAPTSDVTILITGNSQISLSTSSIVFTPTNWNVAQTVTISAVNDSVMEGSHSATVSHVVTSFDASYNGVVVSDVSVSILDNDIAGVLVSPTTLSVAEGGNSTYTLVLTSQPTSNVVVSINGTSQVTLSVASVTFTSSNWNIAQTITVTAVSDGITEGNHSTTITHSTVSSDTNYSGISVSSVTVNISEAATDPNFSNVVLLLHYNGANNSTIFTDSSLDNRTITANGQARISTTTSVFEGASGQFNAATNTFLSVPATGSLVIGTQQYTLEFFVYISSHVNDAGILVNQSSGGLNISLGSSGQVRIATSFVSLYLTSSTNISLNTWTHVAIVRNSTNTTIYIDGVNSGSAVITDSYVGGTYLIGRGGNNALLDGYLDEMRLTVGVARTITVPTSQYPDA